MSPHNGSEDQVPSPIKIIERLSTEVLNDKKVSVIDEIAAED